MHVAGTLVKPEKDETEELKIELEEIELQYQKVVKDTAMKKHEAVMPSKKILSLKKTVLVFSLFLIHFIYSNCSKHVKVFQCKFDHNTSYNSLEIK
ncbi:hypothetical protein Scep_014491 [Stephania cephalantha]|uniref:Uncharacterized protein n=1 Tax=Stephania cephalantha TaxID=152367 RepID=A0AAP0J239_9MAGN